MPCAAHPTHAAFPDPKLLRLSQCSFVQFDFAPDASSEGVQLAFGLTIALTVSREGWRWKCGANSSLHNCRRTAKWIGCMPVHASVCSRLLGCFDSHGAPLPVQVLLEGNAMVLCSLIHASILKSGRQYVSSQEEADFMARARHFAAT